MKSIATIPHNRYIFCRLASTGKLVIAKYSMTRMAFEVVRDEVYIYQPEDFTGWCDLLDREYHQ